MFYFPNKPIRIYDVSKLIATLPADQWVVQPKYDGKRVEIACDAGDKVTLFGRQGQVFKEEWPWLAELPLPKPWFVDGELLRDGRIFIWDFAVWNGEEKFKVPYQERLNLLEATLPVLPRIGPAPKCQYLHLIKTYPIDKYDGILMDAKRPVTFKVEGVVFKNLQATDLWGPHSTSENASQFKFRI